MSTATATIASASTVLASPATEAAARGTSNVSDCGLFRQRTEVTTVATASLPVAAGDTNNVSDFGLPGYGGMWMRMRQGTLVSYGFGFSTAINDSTRSLVQLVITHYYFPCR